MNIILTIGAGLIVIIGLNFWALGHDREVNDAALAYERCVQLQYHMTPIQWYEQNKQYPLCGN